MPELPEVEAHAERLTTEFSGAVLARFTPVAFHALKTVAPAPADSVGQPLRGVGRRAKYLLLDFGANTFVVHLMQGGRLKPDAKQTARPRGALARWVFEDGRALLLTEHGTERRAGVWVSATDGVLGRPPLDDLGPEAMDVTPEELAERFAARGVRLHTFLRDQGAIAGLGRRLANEVCHRAGLSPFVSTTKLGLDGATRVVAAIHDAVDEGLAYERTRQDMSASADRPGNVHHRNGQPCPVCGDTVREVTYAKYQVNYCPTCQTGGKVLADNTTSKFLK